MPTFHSFSFSFNSNYSVSSSIKIFDRVKKLTPSGITNKGNSGRNHYYLLELPASNNLKKPLFLYAVRYKLPENAHYIMTLENSGLDIETAFKPAILVENFTTT